MKEGQCGSRFTSEIETILHEEFTLLPPTTMMGVAVIIAVTTKVMKMIVMKMEMMSLMTKWTMTPMMKKLVRQNRQIIV